MSLPIPQNLDFRTTPSKEIMLVNPKTYIADIAVATCVSYSITA